MASVFSLRPSRDFQAIESRAPRAPSIKTSYSRYGIFYARKTANPAATPQKGRRADERPSFLSRLSNKIAPAITPQRYFSANLPAAFQPMMGDELPDEEGLTPTDHLMLDGLAQDIDATGADFSQIEHRVAALNSDTSCDFLTPAQQNSAFEALAQVDQIADRLSLRASEIENRGLSRNATTTPQRILPTTQTSPRSALGQTLLRLGLSLAPALHLGNWRLSSLFSLRPRRQVLRGNKVNAPQSGYLRSAADRDAPMRLKMNQMSQRQGFAQSLAQSLAMRTATLHQAVDHMMTEAQAHRSDIEQKLQMKVERRRRPRLRNEIQPPCLKPKTKSTEDA